MQSMMFIAVMFSLSKKDKEIRLIAVGNTLRRLATKVGAKSISASIWRSTSSYAMELSYKDGCEAAAHADRRY